MSTIVEVRCPVGPRKLFTKLKLGEETGHYVSGYAIEFSCSDCSRFYFRQTGRRVRALHQFNFLGDLISTSVEDLD